MTAPQPPGTTSHSESLYLTAIDRAVRVLSVISLNDRWQQHVRRELQRQRSPMWAAEIYQLAMLALGGVMLVAAGFTGVRAAWFVVYGIVAAYRIIDIAVFGLYWVFVDRREVKDFRRSLLYFCLSLVELVVFGTLLVASLTPAPDVWGILEDLASATLTMSVPDSTIGGPLAVRVAGFALLGVTWLLTLVVVSVTVSGISKREMGGGG